MRRKGVLFWGIFFSMVFSFSPSLGAPRLAKPSLEPAAIYVGIPTVVTIRVEITDSTLIKGSVNLLLLDESGKPAIKAKPSHPLAVAMDTRGSLIIAEQDNDRFQEWWREWAIIGGRVTDSSTGLPLSEVLVTVKSSVGQRKAKTDSNGRYIVFSLTPGKFMATFEKSGYFTQIVHGTLTGDEARLLNIQMVPVSSLSITITSPQDGAIFNSSPIPVTGNVSHTADVAVNGIKATVKDNTYSVMIPLVEGLNPVVPIATDAYGQTASKSIQVTLITRGAIRGTVTDALTGIPVSAATVSITDSSNNTKTALTDENGKYRMADLAAGAFNANITKDGYKPYPSSGTLPPGQTLVMDAALNRILPVISNIAVSGTTMTSATITWTTDQPADSLIDYGTSPSYGNWVRDQALVTSHSLTLSNLTPGTTYHYKATSTNAFGFSSSSENRTFATQQPLLSLAITYPNDGAIITRADVLVRGMVVHGEGKETGVAVNGKVALVFGNEFVVNHVPLQEGANTLQAVAKDIQGNTVNTSAGVNAIPAKETLTLMANVESGISPLEVLLTIDSSLNLANASLTYTGPGEVEFLSSSANESRVKIAEKGIYYFTVSAEAGGIRYEDSIAVVVLEKADLDLVLSSKWELMKAKLQNQDIEGALEQVDENRRSDYRKLFDVVSQVLPALVQEWSNIQLIEFNDSWAVYDIQMTRDGMVYSFQLLFTKDSSGIWRITSF